MEPKLKNPAAAEDIVFIKYECYFSLINYYMWSKKIVRKLLWVSFCFRKYDRPMNLIIIKIRKWEFGVEKKKMVVVHCWQTRFPFFLFVKLFCQEERRKSNFIQNVRSFCFVHLFVPNKLGFHFLFSLGITLGKTHTQTHTHTHYISLSLAQWAA